MYFGIVFSNFGSTKSSDAIGFRFNSYNATGLSSLYSSANTGYTCSVNAIKHIAYVYTASECKRYVNGELADTTSVSFPSAAKTTNSIGGWMNADGWHPDARIYRIGISGHAMTAAEVAQRYAFFAERFGIE